MLHLRSLPLIVCAALVTTSVAEARPNLVLAQPGYEEPVAAPAPAPAPAADPAPAPDPVVVAPAPTTAPAPVPPPAAPPPSRRRGIGMMVAGYTMFGVSYMITAFSGAVIIDRCSASASYDCRDLGRSLMLPVIGPFAALPDIQTMTGRFAMVFFPGLMQVGGLTLGIAGTVIHARSRRHAGLVDADGIRLMRGRQVRVAPTSSGASSGLQLTYRF